MAELSLPFPISKKSLKMEFLIRAFFSKLKFLVRATRVCKLAESLRGFLFFVS
jgi:hypothetical protein